MAMVYEFGPFRLDLVKRSLFRDGQKTPLRGKAFDLLSEMIARHGRPVSKEELIHNVWGVQNVSLDNTFSVTLSEVRKALGDSFREPLYIQTAPDGYRFIAQVREVDLDNLDNQVADRPGEISDRASKKLETWFGSHQAHVLAVSLTYSALASVMLVAEVGYEFDRYRLKALIGAVIAGSWVFASSLAALAIDWRITVQGSKKGLWLSALIILGAAMLLVLGACLILPASPITQQTTQAAPAQSAYLKDSIYHLLLVVPFVVIPFHFVAALERDLRHGGYGQTVALLTGEKLSSAPKGSIYVRLWVLGVLLVFYAWVAYNGQHNLARTLVTAPYMNLFVSLLWMRLALFFGLGIESMAWYYVALNELKRDSFAARPQIGNQSSRP